MTMHLTVAEAATVLGCSPRAVRARLSRGELKGVKQDGHLDALGYRLRRGCAEPLPRAARRLRARVYVAARTKRLDLGRFRGSMAASVHHLLG